MVKSLLEWHLNHIFSRWKIPEQHLNGILPPVSLQSEGMLACGTHGVYGGSVLFFQAAEMNLSTPATCPWGWKTSAVEGAQLPSTKQTEQSQN